MPPLAPGGVGARSGGRAQGGAHPYASKKPRGAKGGGGVTSSTVTRLLRAGCLASACLTAAACSRPALSADPARRVEWPAWGNDPGGQRYSPLETINPGNVSRLRPAWEWETGERTIPASARLEEMHPDKFEATPVMLGDTLYLTTPFNLAVALDAESGKELWRFDPGATDSGRIGGDPSGFVHRGVAVWTGPAERRVLFASRWKLFALDARTGQPIPGFGSGGTVDLSEGSRWRVDRNEFGNTSPPLVFGNLVIVGGAVADRLVSDRDPPGEVKAFDVITGKLVWRWETVPRAGMPGSETWEDGAAERTGHANVWAPFTVDIARGLIYLPVSASGNDYYGGRRKGNDLFGDSLVCLDARTGRMVWYYQVIHHGLWDYDPPAQPNLLTLHVEGRVIDAVALAGKSGFLYVFDRVTGVPVWPIIEQPVPSSDVPGERASPTQPIPTRPAAFTRQGIADSDLVDFTPALRARARALVSAYRLGPLFSPPSREGTVLLPGWIGGAGWGGGAFDPETGTLFVKGSNLPILARLISPAPGGRSAGAEWLIDPASNPSYTLMLPVPTHTGMLSRFSHDVPVPLIKPPYGTLTAFDLNRGEIRWRVPLGDTPEIRFHPALRGLKLPPLGVAGAPGPLVTRSGLIFVTGGGETLYALSAATGAVLWSAELGRIGYANPMTYRTARGRQYVVIATGIREGARLRAFALPDEER